MRKFCPRIKEECKQDACMYWFEKGNDCLPIYTEKHTANYYVGKDQESKIGLDQINQNLSNAISETFITDLVTDPNTPQTTKDIIRKLWGEKVEKEKLINLKKELS